MSVPARQVIALLESHPELTLGGVGSDDMADVLLAARAAKAAEKEKAAAEREKAGGDAEGDKNGAELAAAAAGGDGDGE